MTQHSFLSPSSSNKWIHYPGALRLEELFEKELSNQHAGEGSACHALAYHCVLKALGEDSVEPKSAYIDREMRDYVDDYVAYIAEESNQLKDVVWVEQRVDLRDWIPDGIGTLDVIVISENTLKIIDLKYGFKRIEAQGNFQLSLYALGAMKLVEGLYDIDSIKMTIFQPGLGNLSEWQITKEELIKLGEEIRYESVQAFLGEGPIVNGPWLQYSSIRPLLKERAKKNLELIRYKLKEAHLLSDAEIEDILVHVDDLVDWAKSVKEYAEQQAIKHNKRWNGFKLVEPRTLRKYSDELQVTERSKANTINAFESKLLPIAKLEKQVGKKRFTELFAELVTKPIGSPTLVPESDNRPVIDSIDATEEFNQLLEEIIMSNQQLTTRVLLPEVRLTHPFIWEPRAQFDGGKEKYSCSLLINKNDTASIQKVQKAIKNVVQVGAAKFDGKISDISILRTSLRDGDDKDDVNYQGHYFINVSSIQAPQIVDQNVDPIIDRASVYAGCYCNVTVNFYAYNVNGNRGVAAGLGNIQFIRGGEPLGRRTAAASDFTVLTTDDDFLA